MSVSNTTLQSMFQYLLKNNSERGISDLSGIPRSTIYDFKNNIRNLPDKYTSSLENLYHRQAYSNLRDLGMNTDQANKYSKIIPTSLEPIEQRMNEIVNYLTDGLVTQRKKNMKEGVDYLNEYQLYNETKESIKDGLRNSQKQLIDWENY